MKKEKKRKGEMEEKQKWGTERYHGNKIKKKRERKKERWKEGQKDEIER